MKSFIRHIALVILSVILLGCNDKQPVEPAVEFNPQPESKYSIGTDMILKLKGTGFTDGDTFRMTRTHTGQQFFMKDVTVSDSEARIKLPANFPTGTYEINLIRTAQVILYGVVEIRNPKYVPDGPEYFYLTAENHPRLLMNDEELATLKSNLSSGGVLTRLHDNVIAMADEACSASPLVYELDAAGKRLLSVSQAALQRIFSCAYAYRVTGNAKYLTSAERDMTSVCAFADWNADTHYLDVAEMCAAVAFGYDWLYNALKPETLRSVEKAVVDYAFIPADDPKINETFYGKTTNWNQVCNGGLVCAALAIYEKQQNRAQKIIDNALSTNKTCMQTIYSPTGNYPEGYGYWSYGTGYEVLMLSALESTVHSDSGLSKVTGFDKTAEWLLYMAGPNGAFSFGDNGSTMTPMLATWYFADKYNNPSLVFNDLYVLENSNYVWRDRLLPMVLAFASRIDLNNISKPSRSVWAGEGASPVVLIRNGWNWDESDTYLAIKGGAGNVSHGHLDGGSFIYDYNGVRWADDIGPQTYATAEKTFAELGWGNFWSRGQNAKRWTCVRLNNLYHNTITVNNAIHTVSGVAKFTEVIDKADEKGAVVDISENLSSHLSKAVRTIKLQNNKDLVVSDDITTTSSLPAEVRWTMLTPATPEIGADGITLTKNGKKMRLTVQTNDGSEFTYKIFEQNPDLPHDHVKGSWEDGIYGHYRVGFVATMKASSNCVFTTKLTPVN